jgi:hypothetical protein
VKANAKHEKLIVNIRRIEKSNAMVRNVNMDKKRPIDTIFVLR